MEIIIQRRSDGQTFNITELVRYVEWSTDIDFQPGKLTFEYVEDPDIIPHYGDIIRFRYQDTGVFFGRVFTKRRRNGQSHEGVMEVVAYDQKRFLKNQDTYVFPAMTSSQIFSRLCHDSGLRFRVVDASPFNVPAQVHDNQSKFSIIESALTETLINTGQWYIIKDNFGILEHVHLNRLQTGIVIGDQSMARDFEFEGSIAADTFNQVRLIQDNPESLRREVYIVQDSANIALWGPLQYHEKVEDNLNAAQIRERAHHILTAKNRPTRSLSIPCLGDARISAGNGVILSLERLRNEGFSAQQRALVSKAVHRWSGSRYTMDLELRVVN